MKILLSAYACNPAASLQLHPGEDLTGWELMRQVARRHRVWVITHSYNRPGIEMAKKKAKSLDAAFIFVQLPKIFGFLYKFGLGERLYYYFWQVAAWRTARRLHRIHKFDLAHHVTFGNYWMPSFIGAFLPVPFVWGPMGGGQKTPSSLFRHYTLSGQLAEIGRDFAQWLGRNVLLSRRRCLRRAASILVCNRETKLQFPKKFWPRIQYFPVNGISAKDLAPLPPSPKSSVFRVLTAGRLIRLKGIDLCLEAFSHFVTMHPNSLLEIVGQGPEEARLRQWTVKHHLQDRVLFVPWLDRSRLLKKMRKSDVFVFASFRDGGGAVVVEAMASGLPVICLDTGGPGFHVQNGWGIKVRPESRMEAVENMSRALKTLQEQPAMRNELGRAAIQRAKESYIWDILGRRLDQTYRTVLGKWPNPRRA